MTPKTPFAASIADLITFVNDCQLRHKIKSYQKFVNTLLYHLDFRIYVPIPKIFQVETLKGAMHYIRELQALLEQDLPTSPTAEHKLLIDNTPEGGETVPFSKTQGTSHKNMNFQMHFTWCLGGELRKGTARSIQLLKDQQSTRKMYGYRGKNNRL